MGGKACYVKRTAMSGRSSAKRCNSLLPMHGWSFGLLSILLPVLFLGAGCTHGSSNSEKGGSRESAPTGPSAPAASSQDPVALALKSPGIVILGCRSPAEVTVSVFDPNTGQAREIAARAVSVPEGVGVDIKACDANNESQGVGQLVQLVDSRGIATTTSDGSRLALQMTGFPDGSSHVGYYDLASAQLTDLTAISTTNQGFSTAPADDDPYFYSNEVLRFYSKTLGNAEATDIDLRTPSVRSTVTDEFQGVDSLGVYIPPGPLFFGDESNGIDVRPHSLFVRDSGPLVPVGFILNPSGNWAVGLAGGTPGRVSVLAIDKSRWLAAPVQEIKGSPGVPFLKGLQHRKPECRLSIPSAVRARKCPPRGLEEIDSLPG
jgi:hypothetical protein